MPIVREILLIEAHSLVMVPGADEELRTWRSLRA
nr:MAG TPA: hypothetical protein [Caudoviricetes sp.]